MLSNKLTFSLASLVVLLMVGLCLPASAQIIQVPTRIALPAPSGADTDGDGTVDAGTYGAGAAGFVVYSETAQAALPGGSGIAAATLVNQAQIDLPDLEAFFRFGGTLALVGSPDVGGSARDFVISEIMWAADVDNDAATANDRRQWIEIYNTQSDDMGSPMATEAIAAGDLSLVFIPYRHVEGNANILGTTTVAIDGTTAAAIPAGNVVYDVMSNLQFVRWDLPGMSGNTTVPRANNPLDPPVSPLVSVYRNINYARVQGINNLNNDNTVNTVANRNWQLHLGDSIRNGYSPGSWIATNALGRRNTLSDLFVGSPGVQHVESLVYTGVTMTNVASDSVVINEVRNDTSPANVDWVELYNRGTEAVGLRDWELTIVQGGDASATDRVLVGRDAEYTPEQAHARSFPRNEDFKLQPGDYLLIVNRDPRETVLADGINIDGVIAGTNVNAGATHQFIVRDMLNLPDANFTLLLRNHVERNARHAHPDKERVADARATTATEPSQNIQDYAGSHSIAVTTNQYNTQRWPLRGWSSSGGEALNRSFGSASVRLRYQANDGHHGDAWGVVGAVGGIGYDPGADLRYAPGTPGYANNALKTQLVDDMNTSATADDEAFMGAISISEVMVDAGPRWNLVQWIELYNSSMTQAINLEDWEMEIRNATDDVESYVDSGFVFNRAIILPNQTLLIVSGSGTNDVAPNRVYNLYQHHRRELGLTNRRSVLLSPSGFYLQLTDRNGDMVDEAGNVMVDGASRNVMWELPSRDEAMRQSLLRQYGTRELYDGTPDMADDGTMEESWRQSDIAGAGISFYGHRDDISTPGYRLGGPLPVSLSSFRPTRDAATGHVVVRWITESELNNAGFNVLRSETKTGEFKVVNVRGIIAGHGTTSEKHVYTFTDTTAKPNVIYYYQIEDVSLNGQRTTLATQRLKGHVSAAGKVTTTWGDLKHQD